MQRGGTLFETPSPHQNNPTKIAIFGNPWQISRIQVLET